jgi:hypothetical protein
MTAILAALLALLAILSPADYRLARVIAGEASGCPLAAQIAVAHVYARNPIMYGDAEPTAESIWVVAHLDSLEDTSEGAMFLLSREDVQSGVLADALGPEAGRWTCDHGYELIAFKGME